MKKPYGKIARYLSLLTALLLLLPTASLPVSAKEPEAKVTLAGALENEGFEVTSFSFGSDGAANGETVPTVIVPGFGQSKVFILDGDGNYILNGEGKPQTVIPFRYELDFKKLIAKLLPPLLGSVFTQSDFFFSRTVYNTLADVLKPVSADENGYCATMREEIYEGSMKGCTEEQKSYIYGEVPLREYTSVAGEENLYYFSYNSFGNMLTITERLIEYLDTVKRETGSDKVNLCFISLGGSIADMLLELCLNEDFATPEKREEIAGSINEILFVIPAADGSMMFSDIYSGNISDEDHMLYRDIWTSMMDGYTGYLIGLGLRLLPSWVLKSVINSALDALRDSFLINCTMMWGLVPSSSYEALAEKYLSDDAHRDIRRQLDMFHEAQLNMKEHLQYLMDEWDVRVYALTEYDYPGYKFVKSWDDVNGDGLIHLSSASFGAHSVPSGQTLPDGYVQQNTSANCSDTSHNHISPDRVVDASTGLLPDTTWYFDGQAHEQTIWNGVIVTLLCKILLDDEITDVYSDPRYPQFMCGRNTKKMNAIIAEATAFLRNVGGGIAPADREAVETALAGAERARDDYLVPLNEFDEAYQALFDALVRAGLYMPAEKTFADKIQPPLTKLLAFISDLMLKVRGGKGFFEL